MPILLSPALAQSSTCLFVRRVMQPWLLAPLLWMLAALTSTTTLNAQAPTPATLPVRLRLLAFHSHQATEEAFLHDPAAANGANGTQVHIKSYLNHQSEVLTPKSRKLVFTRSANRASLADSNTWLAEVSLPAGVRSAVLLFMPESPDSKIPFRIMVIDDSKESFPQGTFRVTNLSPLPVRIELEKRPWVIQPGKTELISDPPVRHGNLCGMKTFVQEAQGWRRIASGIWPHPGKKRVIQLLYYHPAAKQVQLRAFDDVQPPEAPPQPRP